MAGTVLLTGATGLIGRATAPALAAEGFRVIAVSRSGVAIPGATGVSCDLLSAEDRERLIAEIGPTHLVHLAWADGRDRWTSPANQDWAAATVPLLEAFARNGGGRAVLAGSCAEYDWSSSILSETTPLRPASPYGIAKAAAFAAATATAPRLGLLLAWARPFFVYGPGEPRGRLIGDLVRGLRAGERVACTDGLQRRDYLYSADLGRALATLTASDVTGPINLGSGIAIAVRDLIREVAAQIDGPGEAVLAARPRAPDDPAEIRADVSRLSSLLGFRPAFGLREGVADLLANERVAA